MDEIFEVLIHESVHVWNLQNGIPDCTGNGYHNQFFREKAQSVGLTVYRSGHIGWAYTELPVSGPARDTLHSLNPDEMAFVYARGILQASKKPAKLKKWACNCPINIRVAVQEFDATCNICGSDFKLEV